MQNVSRQRFTAVRTTDSALDCITVNLLLIVTKTCTFFFLSFSLCHEEVMSGRQQYCEARGDKVLSSTDTSRWSATSGLICSSSSTYTSEGQEGTRSLINRIKEYQSSDTWQTTRLPIIIEGTLLVSYSG